MRLSVIICTHNPRRDYLERTLIALRSQTLPQEQWELLLIDNASRQPLTEEWDLTWHARARHVREEELGLTPTRLRGISEATGELLVFVDDDNVLDEHYLECALELAGRFPYVGAFGGATEGEHEIPIPAHLEYFVRELGDIVVDRDYWSNLPGRSIATPIGAGLCVRRQVALDYASKTSNDPLRKMLDRSGAVLLSGGDLDLAWCAIDAGMGTGRFKNLKLTHLIPQRRITDEYIIRLYAGYAASGVILASIRPTFYPQPAAGWKTLVRFLVDYPRVSKIHKKILIASRKARREARQMVRNSH
jgi:glycosyltransferase involved in cell wall biosynthesis